jgi:hypothetical protein
MLIIEIEEQLKLNEHLSKDLEDMPENEHDREFEVFKKRISSEPKQVWFQEKKNF